MRKIVIRKAGGYDRLEFESVPDPLPRAGEVCVTTQFIGVNYADCVVRMGLYSSAREFVGWPITPGFEFAGTVSAIGHGVDDLAVGDRVFGVTLFGAYATHVCVARRQLFAIPSGWDLAQSAAFSAVFLSAWYALAELAHPRPGSNVLVHSAAGGVGGALVQLARIRGCRIAAVVGASHKIDLAKSLGADLVIDKSRENLWNVAKQFAPRGYDVIFDANGVSTLRHSYRHLASPGRLVIYGFHSMLPRQHGRPNYLKLAIDYLRTPRFDPLRLTNENRSVLAFNLSYLFEREDILLEAMTELLSWVRDGQIVPPQVARYPFDRVADAHRAIESGKTVGKLVLSVE